jgi:hypothetical protein
MTRATVGKLSSELIIKEPETQSPLEQMQENLTQYDAYLHNCALEGKKVYPRDFFLVVLTKKERLMPNVIRNYFIHRVSCPTPTFDQAVYQFHRAQEKIEFLWVVPSQDTCQFLLENIALVDKSEHDLLKFVIDFSEGILLKKAKILNGELEV